MSKLNDLITQLCPDGVPYKKLGEIAVIKKGTQLNKSMLLDDGKYPVLNGGKDYSGYWNKYNFDGDRIAISQGGASAGFVTWMKKPFWAGAHCYVIDSSKESELRYLFHVVKSHELDYMEAQYGAGIPSLSLKTLSQTEIPLPPLPVQEEVVRILDSFTTLEAELEAELADRKKQYEYYRDYLLDKNTLERMDGKPVEMKKLGEVEEDGLIKLGRGNVISKRDIANNPGIYPIYSASVTNNGKFGEYGNYMFDDIRLTWSIDGGGRFFYRDDEKYSVTNVCGWLKVLDANAFNPKFLFYVLTSQWNNLVFNYTVKAHPSVIRNIYDIPMVSLSTQERVVDILDRFDTLTTSLTDGIPAEIAMRREQYEYYRSRLLDFPHLPDGSASVSDSE